MTGDESTFGTTVNNKWDLIRYIFKSQGLAAILLLVIIGLIYQGSSYVITIGIPNTISQIQTGYVVEREAYEKNLDKTLQTITSSHAKDRELFERLLQEATKTRKAVEALEHEKESSKSPSK